LRWNNKPNIVFASFASFLAQRHIDIVIVIMNWKSYVAGSYSTDWFTTHYSLLGLI
jgi:hypothetical protein